MVVTRWKKHQKQTLSTQTTHRQSNSNAKRHCHTKCLEQVPKHDMSSLIGVKSKKQGGAKANVTLAAELEYEKESSAEDEVTSSTGAESNNKGGPQDDVNSFTHAKSNKEGNAKDVRPFFLTTQYLQKKRLPHQQALCGQNESSNTVDYSVLHCLK